MATVNRKTQVMIKQYSYIQKLSSWMGLRKKLGPEPFLTALKVKLIVIGWRKFLLMTRTILK